jgi:hypothetical protein
MPVQKRETNNAQSDEDITGDKLQSAAIRAATENRFCARITSARFEIAIISVPATKPI